MTTQSGTWMAHLLDLGSHKIKGRLIVSVELQKKCTSIEALPGFEANKSQQKRLKPIITCV